MTSLVMEKMHFNHFLIISLWELSVAMKTKQEADHHDVSYFELPLSKHHCIKLESYCFSDLGGAPFKNSLKKNK